MSLSLFLLSGVRSKAPLPGRCGPAVYYGLLEGCESWVGFTTATACLPLFLPLCLTSVFSEWLWVVAVMLVLRGFCIVGGGGGRSCSGGEDGGGSGCGGLAVSLC